MLKANLDFVCSKFQGRHKMGRQRLVKEHSAGQGCPGKWMGAILCFIDLVQERFTFLKLQRISTSAIASNANILLSRFINQERRLLQYNLFAVVYREGNIKGGGVIQCVFYEEKIDLDLNKLIVKGLVGPSNYIQICSITK